VVMLKCLFVSRTIYYQKKQFVFSATDCTYR